MSQVIITQVINEDQLKNLVSENDHPQVSINRLKFYLEEDAVDAAKHLKYGRTDLTFIWIDAEPTTHNGVTVECEDKVHQTELLLDLAETKTRIIASLDWIAPLYECVP